MDDINSTINSILGDPQKMEQLRAVAQSLGINPGAAPPPQPSQTPQGGGFDPSGFASILQNFQFGNQQGGAANNGANNTSNANTNNESSQNGGGFNLGSFAKVADIFSTFNQSDKNTDLLKALKPHFSESRAGRIDDAVRIMQLLRAWPALRDSGLIGSLGSMFTGGGSK